MGIRGQQGFTIIETTLFLAVTGLLILMMVAGAGASVSVQQYRDSVESFKSLVQQQYTELASVQNSRDNSYTCSSASSVTSNGPTDQIRGQSGCLMIGKYMRIDSDDISIYTVLATQQGSIDYDDITSMERNYAMDASTVDVLETNMQWGTRIAWSKASSGRDFRSPSTPRTLGILIVRSPDSGLVYTFTSNDIQPKNAIGQNTFMNLLKPGNVVPGRAARAICIESGGLFASGDRGVYLGSFAASTSAVETRSNEINATLLDATRC